MSKSLKEYDFFTYAKADGKKAIFVDPVEYHLEFDPKDTILTLHFLLPLKTPLKAKSLNLEVFDPSYFVDFSFAEKDAVALAGAPAGCALNLTRPQELTAEMARRLAEIPPDGKIPENTYGAAFANKIVCEMSMTQRAAGRTVIALIVLASVASFMLATGALDAALAQTGPFGAPRGAPRPPADGWLGWVFEKQAEFSLAMRNMLRTPRTTAARCGGCSACRSCTEFFTPPGPATARR